MMACHTVHYDTTVLLGRLVPFVSVSIVMLPGRRRSERNKAAREKAMKESEEGAVRDMSPMLSTVETRLTGTARTPRARRQTPGW